MLKKKERNLFDVICVRKHKAEKTYLCPDGVILPGQIYYRGFALCNRIEPFEFFFTNENYAIFGEVPFDYLRESILRYRGGNHKYHEIKG